MLSFEEWLLLSQWSRDCPEAREQYEVYLSQKE
jgi:hypothetical protein